MSRIEKIVSDIREFFNKKKFMLGLAMVPLSPFPPINYQSSPFLNPFYFAQPPYMIHIGSEPRVLNIGGISSDFRLLPTGERIWTIQGPTYRYELNLPPTPEYMREPLMLQKYFGWPYFYFSPAPILPQPAPQQIFQNPQQQQWQNPAYQQQYPNIQRSQIIPQAPQIIPQLQQQEKKLEEKTQAIQNTDTQNKTLEEKALLNEEQSDKIIDETLDRLLKPHTMNVLKEYKNEKREIDAVVQLSEEKVYLFYLTEQDKKDPDIVSKIRDFCLDENERGFIIFSSDEITLTKNLEDIFK